MVCVIKMEVSHHMSIKVLESVLSYFLSRRLIAMLFSSERILSELISTRSFSAAFVCHVRSHGVNTRLSDVRGRFFFFRSLEYFVTPTVVTSLPKHVCVRSL